MCPWKTISAGAENSEQSKFVFSSIMPGESKKYVLNQSPRLIKSLHYWNVPPNLSDSLSLTSLFRFKTQQPLTLGFFAAKPSSLSLVPSAPPNKTLLVFCIFCICPCQQVLSLDLNPPWFNPSLSLQIVLFKTCLALILGSSWNLWCQNTFTKSRNIIFWDFQTWLCWYNITRIQVYILHITRHFWNFQAWLCWFDFFRTDLK